MDKVELKAEKRESSSKRILRYLRSTGHVPAVVYGHKSSPISVAVSEKEFVRAIGGEAGNNVLISLQVAESGKSEELAVMVKDLQRDNLSPRILHIDFFRIELKEKIRTKVHIVFHGVPIGVKQDGGVTIHGLREVEVKCLPAEIPNQFTIDISGLRIGDSLRVSQLSVPAGVEILTPVEESVVSIAAPAKEEVVETPTVAAADVPAAKGAINE